VCTPQIVAINFVYFICAKEDVELTFTVLRLHVDSLSLADPLATLQPALSQALCSSPSVLSFDPSAPNTLLVACIDSMYFLTDQFTCAPGEQFLNGQCQQCARGSFKSAVTSMDNGTAPAFPRCQTCPFNTEQLAPGVAACEPCLLGYTSQGGTDACTQCARDSYTPSLSSGCVSCLDADQEGLECRAGLASVSAGYFAYTVDDSSTPVYRTVRCPPGACVGGPLQLAATDSSAASIITYCLWPRLNAPINVMCGACVAGYVAWHGECVECEGVNGGLVAALIIGSLVLVTVLTRLSASASASSGTALMLLIFFLQCCDVEMGPVSGWLSWLHAANLSSQSASSQCLAPLTPVQQLTLDLCLPFILLGELLVVAVVHGLLVFVCSCLRHSGRHGASSSRWSTRRSSGRPATRRAGRARTTLRWVTLTLTG
jgi:hypothetical protein